MSSHPPVPQQPAPPMQQQPHYAQLHPSFRHNRFLIRRNVLTLVGARLKVFDDQMNLLLFCQMKAFKLKEDISIFADEARTQPLIRIRARAVLDFAAAYDVYDVSTGNEIKIGTLKRKGLKSLIRDEWEIWDVMDRPIGLIREDSGALAILRRIHEIFSLFLAQQYDFSINQNPVGMMKRSLNPFVMKMTADFSPDTQGWFDRRLAAAAAVLLCVIEGRQS